MILANTDKIGHGYLPTYQAIAIEITSIASRPRVLELGVAGGEGLLMFGQLFSTAGPGDIVGVDINDKAVWPGEPGRFVRVVADQADPELPDRILDAMTHPAVPQFHLIVDDASHAPEPTRAALLHLWPLLYPGGYYVIEDWSHANTILGDLAAELPGIVFGPYLLGPEDVESITYRPGLIVLRKRGVCW